MTDHKVVSHEAMDRGAASEFLAKEKEFTRLRDQLSRRAPRTALGAGREAAMCFDGAEGRGDPRGPVRGRSQLVVYHFMFDPELGQSACKSCSFWADNFNGVDSRI